MDKGQFASLMFRTFTRWQKHDASLRAAALTFFTIMPLPSLALIAVAVLAQIYGQQQGLATLIAQVSAFAGPAVANLLSEVLLNAQSPLTSVFGSFLAIVFALAGALGAFSVLQKSLDIIWGIKSPPRGKAAFMKEKVVPFLLIILLGLIVVATTAISSFLFNGIVLLLDPILGGFSGWLIRILEIILSFGLGTLLFAIIFKMLPETKIEWGDVWLAAAITAIIFTALNYFFGLYLSLVQVTTLAGTAGSLIVLFLWIYLTTLFLLFGAEFSKVYTQSHGSHAGKRTLPKHPLPPLVEKVDMTAEVTIKAKPEKS